MNYSNTFVINFSTSLSEVMMATMPRTINKADTIHDTISSLTPIFTGFYIHK